MDSHTPTVDHAGRRSENVRRMQETRHAAMHGLQARRILFQGTSESPLEDPQNYLSAL